MKKEIVSQKPLTPGFGVAGLVMCPFFKGACLKQACELWVELKQGEIWVARCTLSWLSILTIEVRGSIDKVAMKKEGKNAPA